MPTDWVSDTHFRSFLLELLNGSLVDQVASRRRFTGIDVTDDDNVNMNLFFAHCNECSSNAVENREMIDLQFEEV
jgi:hypothetical protein